MGVQEPSDEGGSSGTEAEAGAGGSAAAGAEESASGGASEAAPGGASDEAEAEDGEAVLGGAAAGAAAAEAVVETEGDVEALDAFTLSIGSIVLDKSTNADGQQVAIDTGTSSLAIVSFSVSTASVAANQLLFRVKLPEGVEPSITSNSQYDLAPGNGAGPQASSTDGYWWITWKQAISSSAVHSFTLLLTPFENGVTPDGTTCPITVQAYDNESGTPAANGSPKTNDGFIAQAKHFEWNPVSVGVSQAAPQQGDDNSSGTITLTLGTSAAYNGKGKVYADAAELTGRFTVDYAAEPDEDDHFNNQPLLLISWDDFRDAAGDPLYNADGTPVNPSVDPITALRTETIGGVTYITDFTIAESFVNTSFLDGDPSNDAELTGVTSTIKIIGAYYNADTMIEDEHLASTATRTFYLKAVDASGEVTPKYSYGSTDPVALPHGALNDLTLHYQNKHETGKETFTNFHFAKNITEIGRTPATGTDQNTLGAFAGNIVKYQFGGTNTGTGSSAAFVNKQKYPIDELVIVDEFPETAGTPNYKELLPVTVYPGLYTLENGGALQPSSGSLTITIEYSNATLDTVWTKDLDAILSTDQIDIASADRAYVEKITYTYTDIPADCKFATWPSMECAVNTLPKERENDWIYNTASIDYDYTNQDAGGAHVYGSDATGFVGESTAKFMYRLMNDSLRNRYGFNKDAKNLTQTDPAAFPKAGDILGYSAIIDNKSQTDLSFVTFVDTLSGTDQQYYTGAVPTAYQAGYENSGVSANVRLWLQPIHQVAGAWETNGSAVELTGTDISALGTPLDGLSIEDFVGTGKTLATPGIVTVNNTAPRTLTIQLDENAVIPGGATVDDGYRLIVTYTTKAVTAGTLYMNSFDAYDKDGGLIGSGHQVWSPPASGYAGHKSWVNLTEDVAPTGAPIAGDVLLFKIVITNTTADPLTNITVEDVFEGFAADGTPLAFAPFEAFTGLAGLRTTDADYAKLSARIDVITDSEAAAINLFVYDDASLTGDSTFTPTSIDASLITTSGNSGKFTIALAPGDTLAPGESVTLAYTLKAAAGVGGGDTLFNTYTTKAGGKPVDAGYVKIVADSNASKIGFTHVVKSRKGHDPDGSGSEKAPSTSNLVTDDAVDYTIDIGNYHTRYGNNKTMHMTGFTDTLGPYMTLVPLVGSLVDGTANVANASDYVALYRITLNPDGTELSKVQITSGYTVSITRGSGGTGDTLTLAFTPSQALPAGLTTAQVAIGSEKAQNVALQRIEIEYRAVVDATSAKYTAITGASQVSTNKVDVFLEEAYEDLYQSSGTLKNDDPNVSTPAVGENLDSNADSKSYVESNAPVTILNQNFSTAVIQKSLVSGNGTVRVTDPGTAQRDYRVVVENYGLAPLPLSKLIDLLPRYETYVNGSAQIDILNHLGASTIGGPVAAQIQTDAYTWTAAGYSVGRLWVDGYAGMATANLIVPAAKKDSDDPSVVKPGKLILTYSTTVDKAQALSDLRGSGRHAYDDYNRAAFYPLVDGAEITIKSPAGSNGTHSADGNTTADWDGLNSTQNRYENSVKVSLADGSTAPFVGIVPKVITIVGGHETLSNYDPGTTEVTPGDNLALDVRFGNSTVSSGFVPTTITEGSHIVLDLPPSMDFEGFRLDSTTDVEVIPSWLANSGVPTVYNLPGNITRLVWEVDRTFTAGQNSATLAAEPFIVRVSTESGVYTEYHPQAYYVPQQTTDQYFYEDIVSASTAKSSYTYSIDNIDLSGGNGGLANGAGASASRLVRTDTGIAVYGDLGINANMTVEEDPDPSNIRKTTESNRILTLGDTADERDHTFTYKMYINVVSSSTGVTDPVVINRLPQIGDTRVTSATTRGTEAAVVLADGLGDVSVSLVWIGGGTAPSPTTVGFDPDDFKIEFLEGGAPNLAFTPTAASSLYTTSPPDGYDFEGGSAAAAPWISASGVTDPEAVTAVRVSLKDGKTFTVPMGWALVVQMTARLADGYDIPYKVGYDSFGFSGKVGAAKVISEPVNLGVRTQVPYDSITVTKVLKDASGKFRHVADGTIASNPFKVQIKNQLGAAVLKTLSFGSLAASSGTYTESQTTLVANGVKFTVAETNPISGYKAPVYAVTSQPADQYGNIHYDVTVTNETNLHRVYYHPNGGTGSQVDALNPYYRYDQVSVKDRGSIQRDGYTFLGWNTKADGTGTSYSENQANAFAIASDIVLYAQWEIIEDDEDDDDPPPYTPPQTPTTPTVIPPVTAPIIPQFVTPDPTPDPTPTPTPPEPEIEPAAVPDAPDDPEIYEGQSGNPITDLINGDIPLGNLDVRDAWSLLSAIMSIIALVIGILLIVFMVRRKKKKDEEEEDQAAAAATAKAETDAEEDEERRKKRQKTTFWTVLAAITGLLVIVVWLLLDWPLIHEVWINHWTPIVAIFFVVHIALFIVHKTRKEKEEEEEEEAEAGTAQEYIIV
ncbi:MAG: InlB B-repeat-containing protein [Clostridiales Family XIII bacterium]|nr:InlB B-repeat-containing protein [Clostridiales Family XIII bacterium]